MTTEVPAGVCSVASASSNDVVLSIHARSRRTENVTLNFAQVMVDYQPQKADGTKDGGAIKFGWNIRSNTKAAPRTGCERRN